jgi:hypothetical protein
MISLNFNSFALSPLFNATCIQKLIQNSKEPKKLNKLLWIVIAKDFKLLVPKNISLKSINQMLKILLFQVATVIILLT